MVAQSMTRSCHRCQNLLVGTRATFCRVYDEQILNAAAAQDCPAYEGEPAPFVDENDDGWPDEPKPTWTAGPHVATPEPATWKVTYPDNATPTPATRTEPVGRDLLRELLSVLQGAQARVHDLIAYRDGTP